MDNATFPNRIEVLCLDLTRKMTVVYVNKHCTSNCSLSHSVVPQ